MWLVVLVLNFLAPFIHADHSHCSKYQVSFNQSCYEFVKLERTFYSAQTWCERGGGHLVFIDQLETQNFLAEHLSQERNWWIGLTRSLQTFNHSTEGALMWLDTSNVSYSYWHTDFSSAISGQCSYIMKDSDYHWGITGNCSQEFYFICQFEFGHTIACDNYNATVQCGSGEVVQIGDSFYGRKNPHFCTQDTPLPVTDDCTWTDVTEQVAGQCHGLQACQVATGVALFGDPCPSSGSYLSINYSCKEGLQIDLPDLCEVFENVTLTLHWLLSPFSGNLSCIITTGDEHSIDPYQPLNLSSSIIHSYKSPGEYTVFVECSTSEWHVTAQKVIIVEEHRGSLRIIGCQSMYQPKDGSCSTLYGQTLGIQLEGDNINYSVLSDNITLLMSRAKPGDVSHNLTINATSQQLIGPGIHQLQIVAYNNQSTSGVTTNITIHLVEPVSGLQAVLSPGLVELGKEFQINVSVSHGAPVQLNFEVRGLATTFNYTKENPSGLPTIYNIPIDSEGIFSVTVEAVNSFSNMSVTIGNITVMNSSTHHKVNQDKNEMSKKIKTTAKVNQTIQIEHGRHVNPFTNITLLWPDSGSHDITWSCGSCWPGWTQCVQQNLINTNLTKVEIPAKCLPPPNSAITVQADVRLSDGHLVQDETCIYVTAKNQLYPKISCKTNCKQSNLDEDLVLSATCNNCDGVKYKWYLDTNFPVKPIQLPAACQFKDFRQSSLMLLHSDSSLLILNNTFLKSQSETFFKIKLTAMNAYEYGEDIFVVSTLPPPEIPNCIITPEEGTLLTSFQISCTTPCSLSNSCTKDERVSITYCFYPKIKSQLYCGPNLELPSVYLPPGDQENDSVYNVTITATNQFGDSVSTTLKVKVKYDETNTNSQALMSFVSEMSTNFSMLDRNSASLVQLYKSISSMLNQDATMDNPRLQRNIKTELREMMLTSVSAVNITSLSTALEMSEMLNDITLQSDELSTAAQVEASIALKDISKSLLTMSSDTSHTRREAANYLFNAVSNVLEATTTNGTHQSAGIVMAQSSVVVQLLSTVDNLQSALLMGKQPDNEPTILSSPSATMYINRLQSDQQEGTYVTIKDSSTAAFSLPSLSSLGIPIPNEGIVDLRMVSFSVNPFSSSDTIDISGSVGGLSLTSTNGSVIPVKDLTEHIEIILPRSSMADEEKNILSLGNFTALLINVTSANIPLVIHLETSVELPLVLYLGYEFHPNETNYDIMTHLPNDLSGKGNVYSWVLHPEELIFGEGTYYLTVESNLKENVSDSNISIAVTCFSTQCVFWDEINQDWNNTGCYVGPYTTPSSIQCLCTHLTFFGSSFIVMPNAIDVSRTVELFATFVDNPVVITTVGCIAVLYVLVLIWARRKDIQDNAKVKIITLEDNDPVAQYRYLVTIFTGHRRGAATTSKVTITLYGSDGESDPHHLYDADGAVFDRGDTDVFLLTTLFPLGELESIRLWHDNSGDKPSWYVNRVLVHDVERDQKWYFLCNSWLSIEVGDCVLDKVFSVATEQEMKQFSNLFFMKTSKGFRDGHIWYSVFSRSPRSPFTRVQRVSCCFSLLLCTMLTSIMFWGVPTDPAEQKMDLGKIEFTWQEVMIGFESSLLMFPINLLIVQIFRKVRPRKEQESKEKKTESCVTISTNTSPSPPEISSFSLTAEAVLKDIRRIANSLFKSKKTPALDVDLGKTTDINKLLSVVEDIICQQNRAGNELYEDCKKKEKSLILNLDSADFQEMRSPTTEKRIERHARIDHNRYLLLQLQHVERKLEFLGPHQFHKPQSYSQAVTQVQRMKGHLENQLFASSSSSEVCSSTASLSADGKKTKLKGLPWWFVFIGWFLVLATSGVSGFFTMLYGLHYGKDSSIKWLISMAISFFESLFITQPLKVLGFAAFFALVLKKVEPEDEEETNLNGKLSAPGDHNLLLESRRDSKIYQPPPPSDINKMKNNYIKEQKVFALIREILAYLGFLWMLLLVAYGQRDPNSYYLNKHLENSFTDGLEKVCSYQQFFTWANTTLVNNLYGSHPGFVTDGNSKLVGSARFRQVRVKRDSCSVARVMQEVIQDCRAPYSLDTEDTSHYDEQWNRSVVTNTTEADSAWHYQSQARLRGHPTWGKLATYKGGGYVVHLGNDRASAYRVLQKLFNNTWLDKYTRAVFVEFTIYNANVNLFCIVRLMFETNALGAFYTRANLQSIRLYPFTDGLHIFVIAAEVLYFLLVIYYMVVQGKIMKTQKWQYFKSKWNLLEMALILISWSALSVFVKRTILGTQDITYYQEHKNEFVSFNETAAADAALGYLIAFLVLLSTIKLWHLLRLNPKLNMITATLRRAWGDISGFITVIMIMFLAYSIASNLIFGWKLSSYKTLLDSAKTMVSLQLGIFNYEEVLDYNPVLGSFLVGSCIIFMTFVVLNLFISVILVAFSEEQKNHKASEEEEIVDLMLMKISSFLGLRHKRDDAATAENIPKVPRVSRETENE
ncbi:polycystic kidney disease protein 1-like 2 [Bombina bombina]|uniref:polycystic kidney disease protein 1-like 2 n=1 Tax=Bombina bombina TaxID=8345 RepID=UPI00235A4C09|nr:polycystic kidney disease protein 1-like 2 [Bombina bombina]